jgi:hypothetical protein
MVGKPKNEVQKHLLFMKTKKKLVHKNLGNHNKIKPINYLGSLKYLLHFFKESPAPPIQKKIYGKNLRFGT